MDRRALDVACVAGKEQLLVVSVTNMRLKSNRNTHSVRCLGVPLDAISSVAASLYVISDTAVSKGGVKAKRINTEARSVFINHTSRIAERIAGTRGKGPDDGTVVR